VTRRHALPVLLLVYTAASLVHFIHNAEFLADYPGMPASWTREGVYAVWVAVTLIGVVGWLLATRGYPVAGLLLVALYAVCGLDSLGHYLLAPMSGHTAAMNSTILAEVIAAALVLAEAMRMLWQNLGSRLRGNDGRNT
jgi:hypothetical protein